MIRLTNILAEIKVNEPGPPNKEAIQKFRDRYENTSVIDLLNFLDKHYDEDVTDWWWRRLDLVDENDSYKVMRLKDGILDDVISWASQGDQISKELILKQVNEIKVNDPGQQILFGLKNDGSWTELVKIKGYSDPKKALEKINELFNLYGDDAFYSSWMQTPKLNNTAYAYIAGDGDVSFVNSLSDFSPGFQTEEGWGVAEWSTKAPK